MKQTPLFIMAMGSAAPRGGIRDARDSPQEIMHGTGPFSTARPVRRFFAPGRINLIGEHLDYNGGHVLPAAVSPGIHGYSRRRDDNLIVCASAQFTGEFTVGIWDEITFDPSRGWANYPLGMLKYLRDEGRAIEGGMTLYYESSLPAGSGLSSSAALEMVTALMLADGAFSSDGGRVRMALLAQKMENEFIGVRCGIMDQFAVAMARRGHAILLDTETLGCEFVPAEIPGCALVIMNSNRPRALADSRYNERRAECEAAADHIRRKRADLRVLAQASPDDLALVPGGALRRRARHVITEERRVREAASALGRGDAIRFGELLTESHRSLRDDYEVTGPELDALADAALRAPGCMGARMTGAGFGGCAIALVREESVPAFIEAAGRAYRAATGREAGFLETDLGDGARELNDNHV